MVIGAACALITAMAAGQAVAAQAGSKAPPARSGVAKMRSSTVSLVKTTRPVHSSAQATRHGPLVSPLPRPTSGTGSPAVVPTVPSAGGAQPAGQSTLLRGFDGIDAIQNSQTAGYDLEPPDEGLGAGHGFVANFVNVTGGIYRMNGRMVTSFYLNTFFGESADANTSDPRVFYDTDSGRWIATMLEYQISNGGISESHIDVAVSTSKDPAGNWKLYQIPTTDESHYGCPCLADYPILGVDKYNVYVSTNEFTSDESAFNGAQLYVLSKSQLVAGDKNVNMVNFENLQSAGAPAYHVQPANTYGPSDAEFMLSSLDPNGTSDHRIAVWALTNRTWVTNHRGLRPKLTERILRSEGYSTPPVAITPPGYCSLCGAPTTGKVSTDFDAMQEVQYMDGKLIGALDTGVTIPGDTRDRSGLAWFVVHPDVFRKRLTTNTHITRQGYLAQTGEYLLYPHVNMTADGSMEMVFGMGGPGTFLSAAYSVAAPGAAFHNVKIAQAGTGPDNGFTGAKQYGGVGRWGDYSNGEIIPGTNRVWLATQYIPNTGDGYANWGNWIFALRAG